MAQGDTLYRIQVALSDVDRGVYEALDLRLARHPSESLTYLATRLLAYCLVYAAGIEFSKGGVSSVDEAPVSVRDASGVLRVWVEIGSPSAERVHRASKAAERVILFTHSELTLLRDEARAGRVYSADTIEVVTLDKDFLKSLERLLERNVKLELVHTDGSLYVTCGDATLETTLVRAPLA